MKRDYRKQNKKYMHMDRIGTGKPINKSNSGQNGIRRYPLPSQITLLCILAIIVASIVLMVHWPSLSANALSFDDNQYLVDNEWVQNPGWSTAGKFLTEVLKPSTVHGYYQPLAMISLMLDYAMGGRIDNLRVFHRTSLALHVLNTLLIIVFLYLLTGQPLAAVMAGLLFGVHPMTVETIPWVSERKTLLAAFFSLLSLILYVLYTRKKGRKFYRTSLVMYILALMSKPTSIPLPLLMLLLDYWPIRRLNRRTVLEKIPFFIVGVNSVVITFFSQSITAAVTLPEKNSIVRILLILCHNIIFYLYKIIWPVNLSSHYPFPVPFTLAHPMVLAGMIGTCLLIAVLLFSLRRTQALLAGWLFFFIAILPTMGIIGFTNVIASDKYAYLPSVGLLMTLGWFFNYFWVRVCRMHLRVAGQAGLIAVVLILLVLEAGATRNYLVYWQDSEILYRHMLSLAPQSSPLHNNLGLVLVERGKFDEAISHYEKADQLVPNHAQTYYNIAIALYNLGKPDEAINKLKETLNTRTTEIEVYPAANYMLGYILSKKGKYDEAVFYFNQAILLEPNYAEAYYYLGMVLACQSKMDEAIEKFRKTLQIQPLNANAHKYLGLALAAQGVFDEAIEEYRKAVRINPLLLEEIQQLVADMEKQRNLDTR
ncbi:MAG: tetratricopeptide repeat protein [Ruminiclostridium sp.]|nr:tetratricopeptide repeat protein [Ruminiclostridium sp.]